jgi:hypothetical protein
MSGESNKDDGQLEKTVTALILDNSLDHQAIMTQLETFTETLKRIEAQTTKTNGHVTELRLWRSLMLGVLIILVPFTVYFANQVIVNTGIIKKMEQLHRGEIDQSKPVEIKP